ncbi:hypothetical protein O1L68_18140 [Streptomyces lydicus]|nr:hypothetical protein [Streptomyces lydicus]
MLEKYQGQIWTDEERGWMFALTGEFPPTGVPDLGFDSQALFDDLSGRVTEFETKIQDTVRLTSEAFPSEVADSFKQAMGLLTGAGAGPNVFDQFRGQLRKMSGQQATLSQKLQSAQWEIWAELATMLIELAIDAAMAFFTGGLSMGEAALARARAAYNILMAMHRLLSYLPLGPSVFEMFEEMVQSLAVNLAQLTINPPEKRPSGIDWKNVGESGLFGLAAGGFIHAFSSLGSLFKNKFSDFFKKNFDKDLFNKFDKSKFPGLDKGFFNKKDFFDNPDLVTHFKKRDPIANTVYHVPETFVTHGLGETLSEILVSGALYGQWQFNWSTLVGAGASDNIHGGLHSALTGPGNWLHNKVFPNGNLFTGFYNRTFSPNSTNSHDSGGAGGDVNGGTDSLTGSGTPPVTPPPALPAPSGPLPLSSTPKTAPTGNAPLPGTPAGTPRTTPLGTPPAAPPVRTPPSISADSEYEYDSDSTDYESIFDGGSDTGSDVGSTTSEIPPALPPGTNTTTGLDLPANSLPQGVPQGSNLNPPLTKFEGTPGHGDGLDSGGARNPLPGGGLPGPPWARQASPPPPARTRRSTRRRAARPRRVHPAAAGHARWPAAVGPAAVGAAPGSGQPGGQGTRGPGAREGSGRRAPRHRSRTPTPAPTPTPARTR